MGRAERHDRDGDGRAVHVDGSAQGNRYGIHILVQAQLLAQGHVDGDVGRGASGEESGDAALTQAAEYQGIRISLQINEGDQRIDDQGYRQHAADQQGQELSVLGKDFETVGGNSAVDQAHDTEWRQVDDPADCLGNSFGSVLQHSLSLIGSDPLKGKTKDDGPQQDSDIVGVNHGVDGVCYHLGEYGDQDFSDTLGHGFGHILLREDHVLGQDKGTCYCHDSGQQGGEHVKGDDGTELAVHFFTALGQSADDQHKDQNGGNGFQGAYKERSEQGDDHGALVDHADQSADDHTDQDPDDQAHMVVKIDNCLHFYNSSFSFYGHFSGISPLLLPSMVGRQMSA